MAGILEDMGFQWSEDPNDADFLYNTCTIRDNAEQKVYPTCRRKERTAQPNAGSRWLRRSTGREALLRRVPELDLVMGPQHANRPRFIVTGI